MKRLMFSFIFLLSGFSLAEAHRTVSVSFGAFYSSLGPHGKWIAIDAGIYAWRPQHMIHNWRPYTVGRWAWTDEGWYWVSDEPWGWATYHYGRWYYDDYYGWIWIPGYDWSPAWVEWRYGGDYVGWAPLGPYAVFHIGFGINHPRWWVTPVSYWSFVDCRHIAHRRVQEYVYSSDTNRKHVGRTRSIGSVRHDNGRVISGGPDRHDVERRGSIRVNRMEVVDVRDRGVDRVVGSGGQSERIEVYRPQIDADRSPSTKERPEKIRDTRRKVALDPRLSDLRVRDLERGKEPARSEPQKRKQEPSVNAPQNRGLQPTPQRRNENEKRGLGTIVRPPVPGTNGDGVRYSMINRSTPDSDRAMSGRTGRSTQEPSRSTSREERNPR